MCCRRSLSWDIRAANALELVSFVGKGGVWLLGMRDLLVKRDKGFGSSLVGRGGRSLLLFKSAPLLVYVQKAFAAVLDRYCARGVDKTRC